MGQRQDEREQNSGICRKTTKAEGVQGDVKDVGVESGTTVAIAEKGITKGRNF